MSTFSGGGGNAEGTEVGVSSIESVPNCEVMEESSNTNSNVTGGGGSVNLEGQQHQPATVSVRCSSLGKNGEMVINTIEVSTEELMEELNSEEVEYVYSPNVPMDDEESQGGNEVSTPQFGPENTRVTLGLTGGDDDSATIRISSTVGPRLVIQHPVPETSKEGNDFQYKNGNSSRQECPVDKENDNGGTNQLATLTIIDPRDNVDVDPIDETVEHDKQNALVDHEDLSAQPSFIFASNMQGLEHQIPIIIKTATLAQKTVTAAMQAQSNSGNPKAEKSHQSTTTINVKVLGDTDTSVQLQKYYYQTDLCRVCLLAKENLTPIFEDVSIDDKGQIENARGPNAANKFHLYAALEIFFEIRISHKDGLPQVICMDCYDQVMNFSVYRKRIAIAQTKLNQILDQVKDTNTPTFIPPIGETNIMKTDIYKNPAAIIKANTTVKTSQYSHLVARNLSDRLWDKIFILMSSIVGYKSGKLKSLEEYTCEAPYVSGFFCYACNSTIHGSKEDFAQHYYDFHGVISSEDVLFPCDICGNSYPLKDCTGESQNYSEHWLQHFFLHECNFCSKRMPSSKGLWIHKKSAHSHKEKIFACEEEGCRKSFFKKPQLELHKQSHKIDSTNSMESHASKSIHHICNECNKTFSTQSSLSVHVVTIHGAQRPWKCDAGGCQKRFKRKEALMTHKETVHLNIRKFECEICKEKFKSQSSKTVHMLRHKGERNYTCSSCSQQFFTANGLKSHMVKHQDVGAFSCDECSKVFKRAAYLDDHKRTHTGETPFTCPVCDRAFRMKSNYFKHIRIHKRKNELL